MLQINQPRSYVAINALLVSLDSHHHSLAMYRISLEAVFMQGEVGRPPPHLAETHLVFPTSRKQC